MKLRVPRKNFLDRLRNCEIKERPFGMYSGRRIYLSFSYVTERGGGKMERTGGSKTAKSLSEHVQCN
jgi:hypothetical protein